MSITAGSIVRVRPALLPRFTVATQRQVAGRVGRVASIFTPLGSKSLRASVYWKHKRTGQEAKYSDVWDVCDLEAAA